MFNRQPQRRLAGRALGWHAPRVATRPYVGRLAPSPTGLIHLGIARTALAAWLDARAHAGTLLLRIEDIDGPRVVEGADRAIMRDLAWLGLDWDGDPTWQSAREGHYRDAIAHLERVGRAYPCTCSRREIAQASSAPHGPSDEGPRYPGTCRDPARRRLDRPRAVRFATIPGERVHHTDEAYGEQEQDVHATVGDFVIRRSDGLWAYQLAVTVDDLLQGVTRVVRGADLLPSTPRQLMLRGALDPGAPTIETLHVPLLRGPDGRRLAKRDGDAGIAARRDRGESPEQVVGLLAASLGLLQRAEPVRARDLVSAWLAHRRTREDTVLE